MKRLSYTTIKLLLPALFLILAGCNGNEMEVNPWENKTEIRVSVFYITKRQDTIPDTQSKIYFFYGVSPEQLTRNTYSYRAGADGVLRNYRDESVPPLYCDVKGEIPSTGHYFAVEFDKSIHDVAIAVESNRFKEDKRVVLIPAFSLRESRIPLNYKFFFRENVLTSGSSVID